MDIMAPPIVDPSTAPVPDTVTEMGPEVYQPAPQVSEPLVSEPEVNIPPVEPTPAPVQQPAAAPRVTSTQTSVNKVDPEIQKKMDEAYDRQEKLVDSAVKMEAEKSNLQAQEMKNVAGKLEEENKIIEARNLEAQTRSKEMMDKINALSNDLNSQKVDPNHYFASLTTGQKILTGISVLAGALKSTGPNIGLKMMTDAMDRDIAIQKYNIESGRQNVNQLRGIMKDYMQLTGDLNAASLAAKSSYLKQAELQLEQIKLSTSKPEIAMKIEQGKAAIEMERAKNDAQLNKIVETSQTAAAAKLKELEPKAKDQIAALYALDTGIDKIRELKKAIDTGLIPKNRIAVAKFLGMTSADEAVMISELNDFIMKAVREAQGAKASDQDMKKIEDSIMNLNMNDKAFLAVLDKWDKDTDQRINLWKQNYADAGIYRLPEYATKMMNKGQKEDAKKRRNFQEQ